MKNEYTGPAWKGVLGCFGGLLIHLVVGSVYQWGVVNVYFTSYYKLTEPDLLLENTSIVFPLMMTCIGLGMRPGIFLAQTFGTFWVLLMVEFVAALLVLISSFIPTFYGTYLAKTGFVAVFGIVFGLVAGMSFVLPMIECNKYFPGRRMYVNGIILVGTGLSSAVFGQFSYNFLNPMKYPSNQGYYDGNLEYIARKVPECVRYLSLLYFGVGMIGCLMLRPVIAHNQLEVKRVHNQRGIRQQSQIEIVQRSQKQQRMSETPINTYPITAQNVLDLSQKKPAINEAIQDSSAIIMPALPPAVAQSSLEECPSYAQAFKSRICWILAFCVTFGSCGNLIINGNFKTYVKQQITNDEYLTLIGAIGAIGNGCTRFFWSLLLNFIGFRPVMTIILVLNIALFACLNYTYQNQQLYCFMVFLANACLGGLLVVTPTACLHIYGSRIGSGIYSFYWLCFSLANFIGYAFVSSLSLKIGLYNILYVCLGMSGLVLIVIAVYSFMPNWKKEQMNEVAEQSAAQIQEFSQEQPQLRG